MANAVSELEEERVWEAERSIAMGIKVKIFRKKHENKTTKMHM